MKDATLQAKLDTLSRRISNLDQAFHVLLRDAPWKQYPEAAADKENAGHKIKGKIVSSPSGSSVGRTSQEHQETNNKTQSSDPRWVVWIKRIGIVAGIGYAIVSFFQWKATEKSIYISNRAYLGMKDAQLWKSGTANSGIPVNNPDDLIGHPRVEVQLSNSGNSPAENVVGKMVVGVFDNPFPYRADDDVFPIGKTFFSTPFDVGITTAMKDGVVTFGLDTAQNITAETRDAITQGKRYLGSPDFPLKVAALR